MSRHVSIDLMIAALNENGWRPIQSTVWQSPAGPLFRGPAKAYELMMAHPELNRFASKTAFLAALSPKELKAYLRAEERHARK